MANPIATTGGIDIPQYLAVDAADQYFVGRLNSDDWINATPGDKQAALVQSTRAIDNLNYLGVKYSPTQLFEFPRWQPPELSSDVGPPWYQGGFFTDVLYGPSPVVNVSQTPIIPQEVLIACCENAIVLLGGFDFEIELAGLNVSSSGFASVRDTYDRSLPVTHLRAGIASATAWNYLIPWLADTNSFKLSRVN